MTKVGIDATSTPGSRYIGTDPAVPPADVLRRVHGWLVEDGLGDALAPTPVVWSSVNHPTPKERA